MHSDQEMTVGDVANFLQVTKRTIKGWARDGYIPSTNVDGLVVFNKVDIDNWIEEERQKTHRKTA